MKNTPRIEERLIAAGRDFMNQTTTITEPTGNLLAACERLIAYIDLGCDPSQFAWDTLRAEIAATKGQEE